MTTSETAPAAARLASLDAFRGLTMLYMASEIWGLPRIAAAFSGNPFWDLVYFNTSHVAWAGISFWDLIQPAFMFMVGVALPWSVANRRARGQAVGQLWTHALWRSLVLVALGIFLRSTGRPQTNFTFEDVLTQIGLGYLVLFLLAWRTPRVQAIAAALILILTWGAFVFYPAPAANFDYAAAGVPADWPHHYQGLAAHFNKNSNVAAAADQWFLNLFPRQKPFVFNGGGYLTLNFVPSLATMIFGLLVGGLLRGQRSPSDKIRRLLIYGLAGIAAGWALHALGICPAVKRIWTPSWALLSGGCVTILLALFYWIIDVRGKGAGVSALRAVGMNSIAMYMIAHLWDRFLITAAQTHLGWNVLKIFPDPWPRFIAAVLAWSFLWWCCVWLDRRRLYLRI